MDISYTYNYADYAALNRARARHGKYPKLGLAVSWLVILFNIGISAFFVFSTLSKGGELKGLYFFNGAIGIGLLIMYFLIRPLYLRWYYKQQMIDGKLVKLGFSDNGLSVDMPSFHGHHEWSAVIRADQEPEHFLLWINKVQVYCVPKRGFENTADMNEFRILIASKVAEQELIK